MTTATEINGQHYTYTDDDGLKLLTSPTGKRYVLMPTFRAADEYLAVAVARKGRGLGERLIVNGNTVRVA